MNSKRKKQIRDLREERSSFRKKIKLIQKQKKITNIQISDGIGISKTEYCNMMTGHQAAIPSKGILNFDDFKTEINTFLANV